MHKEKKRKTICRNDFPNYNKVTTDKFGVTGGKNKLIKNAKFDNTRVNCTTMENGFFFLFFFLRFNLDFAF